MTFEIYAADVARTRDAKLSRPEALTCYALGLCCDAGELGDDVKRHVFHDVPLDRAHLVEEAGDTLFYLVGLCAELGITFDEIVAGNIAKRARRFPTGFVRGAVR